MSSLVLRVAARHRASMTRRAALIPDKFFKGFEAEFKQLASESVGYDLLRKVPELIDDRIIPLFQRFVKELIERAPGARETLEGRLDTRVTMLKKLAESYSASRMAIAAPYPVASSLDHILLHIETRISLKLEKDLPTLGKALRQQVVIDPAKVKDLASRALRKATAEDRDALEADDGRGSRLERKYKFLEAHVDGAVSRLVKKVKVETDWAKWFWWIREILEANYTKEGLVTEFDLHGMKIVIDDLTVTPEDQRKYVKYLDEAYQRMKAKKVGRAWYGTVYIECKTCGGVNRNTGGGVGGHFNIEKDHVKIFSRPGKFIVELMAHELGHRYWFRQMSEGQRGRFESLVRTHKGERHQGIIPRRLGDDADKAEREIETTIKALTGELDEFLEAPVVALEISRLVGRFRSQITAIPFWRLPVRLAFETEETEVLYKAATKSRDALHEHLEMARKRLDDPSWLIPDDATRESKFEQHRAEYVGEARSLVAELKLTALRYLERTFSLSEEAADEREKKQQEEWDADPREVLPVSNYGRSNIDEAFAEVFAYYVIGSELTRDQLEAFKTVLLDKDRTAAQVAQRWLDREAYRKGGVRSTVPV